MITNITLRYKNYFIHYNIVQYCSIMGNFEGIIGRKLEQRRENFEHNVPTLVVR